MNGVDLVKAMKLEAVSPAEAKRTDKAWAREWDAKWADVENWWRAYSNNPTYKPGPLRDLLDVLHRWVPPTVITNGTEEEEIGKHPREVLVHLRGAAKILFLGELERAAEAQHTPQSPDVLWEKTRAKVFEEMVTLTRSPEVTEGDSSLSRHAHAERALAGLKSLDALIEGFISASDRKVTNTTDRGSLELINEVVHIAFSVGVHARAAAGKAIESHAVLGANELSTVRRRQEGAAQGGKSAREIAFLKRQPLLQTMRGYIMDKDLPISEAARRAFRKGLGASESANIQAWKRHHKEICDPRK